MSQGLDVAIVGATGAVGQEFLRLFERRAFPVARLRLFASERSAGRKLPFRGLDHIVEPVSEGSFAGCDVAFFSAGSGTSRELVPRALHTGVTVIDNSSAFRMEPNVPLVVPEINPEELRPESKLYAVANCTAIVLCMAVAPLRALGRIERLVVSTYQSASGAGAKAMRELEEQSACVLAGKPAVPSVFPHPIAFNLFSHNTPLGEHGYNEEEWKVIHESRKILGMPDLRVGVTCVRVPVFRAHSEAVTIEFAGEAPSEEAVRQALERAPGIRVVDDRRSNTFPMPIEASGKDEVLVGRIRRDVSHPSAISLFVCGDQLLKGAALNGVQIAEALIERGWLAPRLAKTGINA